MMKTFFLLLLPFTLLIASCKEEPKDEAKAFFPVISFLNSQVAHVDTSVYAIRQVVIKDSIADTTYVQREQFRELARNFLSAPDVADKKNSIRYTETEYYDDVLKKVIITYTPLEKDEDLQRQEVHISPNTGDGDKVSTIIMNRYKATRDSVVQKRMLWQVDERFQIVSTVQKPGQPEVTTTVKVLWGQ